MKKKFFFGTAAAAAVMSLLAVSASAVTVEVNGKAIETDTEPVVIEERTMVPVRAICESLNCDVAWDPETQGISIYRNDNLYCMWIGRDTAFNIEPSINNYCTMDVPPMIINDRTMIPLRAFAELFGAEVNWDGKELKASVDMDLGELEDNKGYAEMFMVYLEKLGESYDVYKGYVNDTLVKKYATIEMQDGKKIELELYPDIAPITVNNFVKLANEKFYDGLVFHRVIKDFMIQGGGYGTGIDKAKEADEIKGEFLDNGWFNLIPHDRGTISMARTQNSYDSASSQFFIVHKDSEFLDTEYAAFGKVINGMDVVDEIAESKTQTIWNGMSDVPVNIPQIKSIRVSDTAPAI